MKKKEIVLYALIFMMIVTLANILVQYTVDLKIFKIPLGVFVYPVTFLLTDILSEQYSKEDVFKMIKLGILFAVIPTIILSTPRIAAASIVTFLIVQFMDVKIFHYLKEKYQNLWWLRNNASTITSQFVDTVVFFILAFAFVLPWNVLLQIMIGNYVVKVAMALLDTPFFYFWGYKKAKMGIVKN